MFSEKVVQSLSKSSLIRAMFEEGEKLRKIYPADQVFDFSLGNPDVAPPQAVKEAFKKFINEDHPDLHKYMTNAGYKDVREKIADKLQKESGIPITFNNVVMTCGAAAAINIIMKSLLNPGEEVIVFSPYFVDYLFYSQNFGGVPVIVPTETETFEPDLDLLEKSITKNTKAIIINTPNNPTGVVYSEKKLEAMARLLEAKEKEYNTNIYVVSDEPYTSLVYDNVPVPSIMKIFKNSIIANSFSKSLSLPGERIGFVAVNSRMDDADVLVNCLITCNRALGFVNAPSLMQKVVGESLYSEVDVSIYKRRRDILFNHLTSLGFSCIKPEGAFYLFPKTLIPDDKEFAKEALKHRILVTPGTGFGCPGYFRIAYCVSEKIIENSLPAWEALAKEFIK